MFETTEDLKETLLTSGTGDFGIAYPFRPVFTKQVKYPGQEQERIYHYHTAIFLELREKPWMNGG